MILANKSSGLLVRKAVVETTNLFDKYYPYSIKIKNIGFNLR